MNNPKTIVNDPDTGSPRREDRKKELMEWSKEDGERKAGELDVDMTDEHWKVVYFVRDYYLERGFPDSGRVLAEALEGEFAKQGGRRYLYTLFPGGPVRQACLIAGLKKLPRFTEDKSFGSAM